MNVRFTCTRPAGTGRQFAPDRVRRCRSVDVVPVARTNGGFEEAGFATAMRRSVRSTLGTGHRPRPLPSFLPSGYGRLRQSTVEPGSRRSRRWGRSMDHRFRWSPGSATIGQDRSSGRVVLPGPSTTAYPHIRLTSTSVGGSKGSRSPSGGRATSTVVRDSERVSKIANPVPPSNTRGMAPHPVQARPQG